MFCSVRVRVHKKRALYSVNLLWKVILIIIFPRHVVLFTFSLCTTHLECIFALHRLLHVA